MSLPKEPRQLMINLMYLVLTALLAMNVSSEILNAFKTIGKSIENSNKSVVDRNATVTNSFQKYLDDPKASEKKKEKVTKAMALASVVNQQTKDIIAQIDNYKEMIIKEAGGRLENGEYKAIDNLDAGTHVMVDQGNGPKLLKSLQDFKANLAGQVPLDEENIVAPGVGNNKAVFDNMPLNFTVEKNADGETQDWSTANFHMSPLIANVTLLDKYKNDVLACQSLALDEIWAKATGEKMEDPMKFMHPKPAGTFPDYAVIVSADNSYVLPGEKYHARIALATYSKTANNLTFTVNGRTIQAKNGMAEFDEIATGNGPKTINVTASFMDSVALSAANQTRSVVRRTVPIEKPAQYFVGEAQATISLDKMNVFYIGVDNPITLSASGIPAGNLSYTSENCTLTKAEGVNKYMVRVTTPGKAYITLTGKLSDGTTKSLGKYEYRVKTIPDPRPVFANVSGGAKCASELKNQIAVLAKLDNFDFEAKFNVISFDVFYTPKRGDPKEASSNTMYTSGPNAKGDVKDLMDALKVGGKLFFDNIRVKGPDGRVRNIGSIVYVINC